MVLGNNILKYANILGTKKVIEFENDIQSLGFERLIDVAYVIRAKHDIVVPPASSYWVKGFVDLTGNEEYYDLPYVECVGKEIDGYCNTVDTIASITFESQYHRRPE